MAGKVDVKPNGFPSGQSFESSNSPASSDIVVKDNSKQAKKGVFSSKIGAFVTCAGSAVGTGNIWRFPRIVAANSFDAGALVFYICWAILLVLWSIPVIMLEYAIGRFTWNTPPLAFMKFWGKYSAWVGMWFYVVVFFLGAYYQVIVGWCIYYLYVSVSYPNLPTTEEEGLDLFMSFADGSGWPVLTQMIVTGLTSILIFGGIRWIEVANLIFVPVLWLILFFMFGWSLTRPYADVGIKFLFTPNWGSFLKPDIWIAAAAQNAFDTNAGMGVLLVYATFMPRDVGIVRYGILIPLLNNFCSFFTSITLFSTVFSTLVSDRPTLTQAAIVQIMKDSGPGSTGLTFTWIPVLLSQLGIFGRVVCGAFFMSLSVAGLLSFTSNIQVVTKITKEFGIRHRYAVMGSMLASASVGIGSAVNLRFLENQDNTWAYGLIISGGLLSLVAIVYGPFRFLQVLINDFGTDDWRIPKFIVPFFLLLVPLEALFLVGYWVYGNITNDPNWNTFTVTSLTTIIMEWIGALVFVIGLNILIVFCWKDAFTKARAKGHEPHDPNIDDVLYGPSPRVKMLFPIGEMCNGRVDSTVSESTLVK